MWTHVEEALPPVGVEVLVLVPVDEHWAQQYVAVRTNGCFQDVRTGAILDVEGWDDPQNVPGNRQIPVAHSLDDRCINCLCGECHWPDTSHAKVHWRQNGMLPCPYWQEALAGWVYGQEQRRRDDLRQLAEAMERLTEEV